MNVKFTIYYDGTEYLGSQSQPNKLSVEDKLQEVFKSLNIETKIVLSGRTDKDVHATGQVFNAKIPEFWYDLKKLKDILNRHLPLSIKIRDIKSVEDSFHARFSAKKRVYRYIITKKELTVFNTKYISHLKEFDEEKIKKAIKIFIGTHDFEYFHKKGSDKDNTHREIFDASFYQYKDLYIFRFCANSYLRSQIRLMVGFLLEIGKGNLTQEDLKNQLKKEQIFFKKPADPYGLYLTKVYY